MVFCVAVFRKDNRLMTISHLVVSSLLAVGSHIP